MRSLVALLSGLAVAACGATQLPDWMQTEARSTDGRLVARLWCEDGCDVPQKRLLTISATAQAEKNKLVRDKADGSMSGTLPRPDMVGIGYIVQRTPSDQLDAQLKWVAPDMLVVSAHCWSDGNFKPLLSPVFKKGLTIAFKETWDPALCEAARARALH